MKKRIIYFLFALMSGVLFSCGGPSVANSEEELITATVSGKEHVVDYDEGDPETGEEPSKHSYYLIYTDKEVFKIEDSLIFGQFNSSDVYGMMKKGKYYRIKTFGVRSGFLSMYQNIIEVEPLE